MAAFQLYARLTKQSGVLSQTSVVDLGTADNYAVLAQSGITNVPSSYIVGNLGIFPATSAAITGFGLVLDSGGTFGTFMVTV
jgi:hypothetical protein